MNPQQRSVLQRHHKQLVEDIILTEELLAGLYQNKVFERHMIELIKAERTETDRVIKMLEMLPRRGPDAFSLFVETIQNDSPWLATLLESAYKQELGLASQTPGTDDNQSDPGRDVVFKDPLKGVPVPNVESYDSDVKKSVGTFVHKQFGQSKRISEKDKKAIERFLNERVQTERERLKSNSFVSHDSPDHAVGRLSNGMVHPYELQDSLYRLHVMLEPYLGRSPANPYAPNRRYVTDDMTFELVGRELEAVLARLDKVEDDVVRVLDHFEEKYQSKPIYELVGRMLNKLQEQDDELTACKEKSDNLNKELDEVSEHVDKVEKDRCELRTKADLLNREIMEIRRQNYQLQRKVESLEQVNLQHLEKEKTLENLKLMLRELQAKDPNRQQGGTDGVQRKTPRKASKFGTTALVRQSMPFQVSSSKRFASNKKRLFQSYTFSKNNS